VNKIECSARIKFMEFLKGSRFAMFSNKSNEEIYTYFRESEHKGINVELVKRRKF